MQQLSCCNLFPRGHTFQGNTLYRTMSKTRLTVSEQIDSDKYLPISCFQYVVKHLNKSYNYINEKNSPILL